jgi:hypothetical protein
MKKAVCVGINNYPGLSNDLKGCVNDANDWQDLLEYSGFQVTKILDAQATRSNILNAFEDLVKNASPGDHVVFTYSGHGTSVADKSGDEVDSYDEALYVHDALILDDELRSIIRKLDPQARMTVIADSCFSGTVTRALNTETAVPRYIKTDDIPAGTKLKKGLLSDEDMVEILLTGCSDSEYSYDAYVNGRWNGAMTANALSIIKKGQTYNEFYSLLRKALPSGQYPQTPQLEGSRENKGKLIFAENTDPLPPSEPEPEKGILPWLKKYWWVIALVIVVVIVLWRIL